MFEHEKFNITDGLFSGIFIGCVENNVDPSELGRCQVRILGLHTEKNTIGDTEGIPTTDLPWAISVNLLTGGSVSGLGINGVPVKGSWVAGFFLGGDHNYPAIFGSFGGMANSPCDTSKGFNDPDGIYPKLLNQPDWNTYARGAAVNHGTAVGPEPANPAAPVYPHNTVQETPDNGIIVECDSTPGGERWHVFHKASQSYMQVGPDGTTVFKSTKDRYEITANNDTVYIAGTGTRTVVGNETETCEANKHKTTQGNELQDISGTLNINITGVCNITCEQKVTIQGKNTIDIIGNSSGSPILGAVQGHCICHFSGKPHADLSSNVRITK